MVVCVGYALQMETSKDIKADSGFLLTLKQWLERLEHRHPRPIDLGLDRVSRVWRALGSPRPAACVIAIGGTNGKGSTVAFAEAAAQALGWRVGAYTSPHLIRYNERIRLDGREAGDQAIVAAFERIEATRGSTSLTYFEFGTLAALLLMAQASPALDLALLEVGLGGRLDAVNIIDADVSVVTTVALDHQEWLGGTRAAIAREKAGIARPGRPLLIGERDAEPTLIDVTRALGVDARRLGADYDWYFEDGKRWFRYRNRAPVPLPRMLPLPAPCQWDNAVTALAALASLADTGALPSEHVTAQTAVDTRRMQSDRTNDVDLAAAATGLINARLPGRLQRLAKSPEVIVDVGHNPQAASMLAHWLASDEGSARTTRAVFSALADKDIEGIVGPVLPYVRHWHLAGLADVTPRGLSADALAERLSSLLDSRSMSPMVGQATGPAARATLHATVAEALDAARVAAKPDERVLAFGSFHVVAEAGKALQSGQDLIGRGRQTL